MQLAQVDSTNIPQAKDLKSRLRTFVAQLEILMWRGVVAFLKWKPGSRLTLSILSTGLILLLLPAGFVLINLGRQLIPERGIDNNLIFQSSRQTQDTNLGQHNLLLILVNNLEQPEVEGVWLVVNGSLNNGSKFLPVEFHPEGETSGAGARLFEVGGAPSKSFVDELIHRGLWWDYYLVIDEAGLGALTGWSVTSGNSDALSSPGKVAGSFSGEDPADVQGIVEQAASLRTLCERSNLINQTLEPETVLALLEGHFRTDYDLSRLAEGWYSFRHRGFAWYCEFPTIKEVGYLSIDRGN